MGVFCLVFFPFVFSKGELLHAVVSFLSTIQINVKGKGYTSL